VLDEHLGWGRDVDAEGILRLFERVKLVDQEIGRHEVTLACLESLLNEVVGPVQIDKVYLCMSAGQVLAIGGLEGGTRQHRVLLPLDEGIDLLP
jgi:hypothetical protein